MNAYSIIITVSTVHPGPQGGAIFTGKDAEGRWIRAIANWGEISRQPLTGEIWQLTGEFLKHPKYGNQLHIEKATLLPPTGKLIISYLTDHPKFRGIGIGQAKASRLYHEFGSQLSTLLENGDVNALSSVLRTETAQHLIRVWQENATETLVVKFLDQHRIDSRLAKKIMRYWPENTVGKLQDNPYRLLLFTGWATVDHIAASLGVEPNDPRRLIAAAEAAAYDRLDLSKDTLTQSKLLSTIIKELISCADEKVVQNAITLAIEDHTLVGDQEYGYQPFGCAVMEQYLTDRFKLMVNEHNRQLSLFSNHLTAIINTHIHTFEGKERIALNVEQRNAVHVAAIAPLSVLTGGAGVGKTTVLKAIHQVVEIMNGRTIQMALAGRAAQRMREATGQEAFTIAGFLNRVRSGKLDLRPGDLVIIDEASMLDLMLVYRVLRALPEGVRLLLVGDPHQLPPIGPGLVFHKMAVSDNLPVNELFHVHRQAESTCIPAISKQVREGIVPALAHFEGIKDGVSFLECGTNSIVDYLLDVVCTLGASDDVQILGATKRGPAGVNTINSIFHQKLTTSKRKLPEWGLAESEPIIFTVNDYDRELYNGSLGCIQEVLDASSQAETEEEMPRIICNFDGREIGVSSSDLCNLDLAYAITIHKAQGSQFQRVIIPITKHRLLDRTLIYTALTRGVRQVIFIGDKKAFTEAIVKTPSVMRRSTGFSI